MHQVDGRARVKYRWIFVDKKVNTKIVNHISIVEKALSDEECDSIINALKNKSQKKLKSPWNYKYYDLSDQEEYTLLNNVGGKLIESYKKNYPEINITDDKWSLQRFRFKEFLPGKFYNAFHSEQGFSSPRLLSIIIYLSDHNCGTEFFNKTIIKSVKGRALVSPPFWTHAHKGQPCPDNKHRYILSAYVDFEK